jgi:hypothetical protein
MTADDLLMMSDGGNYEFVDGQLVDRNINPESSWVAGQVCASIGRVARGPVGGWVFPAGASYQCFQHVVSDPNRVRRADVSFIRSERLPGGPIRKGHGRIAPDLAVEVISPGDLAYDIIDKVQEWLAAGVSQIWVVMPPARTITIYRPDGLERILHENDALTADALIPGFHCRVGDLFPRVAATE